MKRTGDDPKYRSDVVRVKDLGLASYIFANNVKLLKSEKIGDTVYFHFPKDTAEKLTSSYWNNEKPFLPARLLFVAQRSLKDLIFEST